jgi:hypothetical protein
MPRPLGIARSAVERPKSVTFFGNKLDTGGSRRGGSVVRFFDWFKGRRAACPPDSSPLVSLFPQDQCLECRGRSASLEVPLRDEERYVFGNKFDTNGV